MRCSPSSLGLACTLAVPARRDREADPGRQAAAGLADRRSAASSALPLVVWYAAGAPFVVDWPALRGFNFRGGLNMSPEYFALLLGLTMYTAGFIAEIVRAGIQAVPHGQWEAAQALGLRPGHGAEADRPAAGAAGDHPADDQPVPEHHQEQLAGGGHRLPGHRQHRQHHAEPDRPGDRGHRHHHGGLPHASACRSACS